MLSRSVVDLSMLIPPTYMSCIRCNSETDNNLYCTLSGFPSESYITNSVRPNLSTSSAIKPKLLIPLAL